MPRTLLGLVAVAAFAHPCQAEQAGAAVEMVIRLNVRPASSPRPILRYRLLPELKEMSPGNPIQCLMKCMMEQKEFFFDEEASRHRETLLAMPLKELPAQELKEYGGRVLRQVDWAARHETPDWQTLLKLRADGIALLLPEVQQMRSVARALQVRYRAEISQARFDDALRTAKTMFAIARHLGEHPTLIGGLVGVAISSMAIVGLDEMLDQPGCPNLYWALTTLPSPLFPMDKGMEGEGVMLQTAFRGLNAGAPMTKEQLVRFVAEADNLLAFVQGPPPKTGVQAWLDARTEDESVVAAARRRLVEAGLPVERLLRFPAGQVIFLDEKRELEERTDDVMKLLSVPFWQSEALAARTTSKKPAALFADGLLPVLRPAHMAHVRVDQRIALLRHIEALRLHAAEHDGNLPANLSEISLPLPVDPVTGKPFGYEVIGNTAHLRGTPPSGMETNPAFNVHYEMTVQR